MICILCIYTWTLNWYLNFRPIHIRAQFAATSANFSLIEFLLFEHLIETRAFLCPLWAAWVPFPLWSQDVPLVCVFCALIRSWSGLNAKHQYWGCTFNSDCACADFHLVAKVCHCKSSIFIKRGLERAQTRRKTSANSRKTGANSSQMSSNWRKGTTWYHCRFRIGPFFNSEHEGFWLMYFDVTNGWCSPLFCSLFQACQHLTVPQRVFISIAKRAAGLWGNKWYLDIFRTFRAFFCISGIFWI